MLYFTVRVCLFRKVTYFEIMYAPGKIRGKVHVDALTFVKLRNRGRGNEMSVKIFNIKRRKSCNLSVEKKIVAIRYFF